MEEMCRKIDKKGENGLEELHNLIENLWKNLWIFSENGV